MHHKSSQVHYYLCITVYFIMLLIIDKKLHLFWICVSDVKVMMVASQVESGLLLLLVHHSIFYYATYMEWFESFFHQVKEVLLNSKIADGTKKNTRKWQVNRKLFKDILHVYLMKRLLKWLCTNIQYVLKRISSN